MKDIRELEAQLPLTDKRVREAYELAKKGHEGQFRDKTASGKKDPYIIHPLRCAVWWWERSGAHNRSYTMNERIRGIVVMLCHDIKEDCKEKITDQELIDTIGFGAFMDVWWLTSPDKVDPAIKELPREIRKQIARAKLLQAPARCKRFKAIDRLDNVCDSQHDSGFWTKYRRETADLMGPLEESWSELDGPKPPEFKKIRQIIGK